MDIKEFIKQTIIGISEAIIEVNQEKGEYDTCRMVVKALNECFTNPKAVKMTKSNKEQVLILLNLVKQPNKIDGYMDLMEKVALIGAK